MQGGLSMTEQETIKVYELAKELGTDSLSLLDRLSELQIKVKNHMSTLTLEEAQKAREALITAARNAKPTKTVKTKSKTPVTREKKTVAKRAAPSTTAKTSATTTTTPTKAPARETPAAGGRSAIIRRRVRSEDSPETVSTHKTALRRTHTETESDTGSSSFNPRGEQDFETSRSESGPGEENFESASSSSIEGMAGLDSLPPDATPAEKRNFLKIVEAPPKKIQKITPKITPAVRTGDPAPPATLEEAEARSKKLKSRIIQVDKSKIEKMAEEEAARKRGAAVREKEISPEDVKFADYRKKELVFLPKKKKVPVGKELRKTQITTPAAHKRVVEIQGSITPQDLATRLGIKGVDVIRKLMSLGKMATLNHPMDLDTASLVASEYKFEVKDVAFDEQKFLASPEDTADELKPRPPIVTIMGHVDHGKTSLLDAIRETNVAGGEAGGITQHLGAYTIEKNGKKITFIDTPGHEAFTALRARGAHVTDIVILVVAADDGVMPQTREAVNHAKAAGVPIIVAVNKIDKAGANPEKAKQGLAELDLLAEDWGGQTMFVPVSAIKKTNLDQLLESILLNAELLDLKANPAAPAQGAVLEARLAKGRGPVMTALVSRGTLKAGDHLAVGQHYGRVRAMLDQYGQSIETTSPGMAAEVMGLEGVPIAGDQFYVLPSEAQARHITQHRIDLERNKKQASRAGMTLEDLFQKIKAGQTKELNVVLKTDVFGSLEAIRDSLGRLTNDQVKVQIIHSATGGITESDVLLASASNAVIFGFNVRPELKAQQIAEQEKIEIKCYQIIYELIDDVKKAMTGLLDKKRVEKFLGRAEVRETFSIPKIGVIAGTSVIDGRMVRGAIVRLLRDSRIVFEGKMSSLKRFKDDVREVASGFECGIGLENYNDIKPGDVIEAFEIEMVQPDIQF